MSSQRCFKAKVTFYYCSLSIIEWGSAKCRQPHWPHFENNNYTVRDEAGEAEEQGGEGGGMKKQGLYFYLSVFSALEE